MKDLSLRTPYHYGAHCRGIASTLRPSYTRRTARRDVAAKKRPLRESNLSLHGLTNGAHEIKQNKIGTVEIIK